MTNYLSGKKSKVPMIYDNWNIYSKYQYGGLIGSLMKYCHAKLENNLPKENYIKIQGLSWCYNNVWIFNRNGLRSQGF